MYDSVYLDVKCPKCFSIVENGEFQTKDLDCNLDKYKPGDFLSKDYKTETALHCIGECRSTSCIKIVDTLKGGYQIKRGTFFSINIKVENGIITNQYLYTDEEYKRLNY